MLLALDAVLREDLATRLLLLGPGELVVGWHATADLHQLGGDALERFEVRWRLHAEHPRGLRGRVRQAPDVLGAAVARLAEVLCGVVLEVLHGVAELLVHRLQHLVRADGDLLLGLGLRHDVSQRTLAVVDLVRKEERLALCLAEVERHRVDRLVDLGGIHAGVEPGGLQRLVQLVARLQRVVDVGERPGIQRVACLERLLVLAQRWQVPGLAVPSDRFALPLDRRLGRPVALVRRGEGGFGLCAGVRVVRQPLEHAVPEGPPFLGARLFVGSAGDLEVPARLHERHHVLLVAVVQLARGDVVPGAVHRPDAAFESGGEQFSGRVQVRVEGDAGFLRGAELLLAPLPERLVEPVHAIGTQHAVEGDVVVGGQVDAADGLVGEVRHAVRLEAALFVNLYLTAMLDDGLHADLPHEGVDDILAEVRDRPHEVLGLRVAREFVRDAVPVPPGLAEQSQGRARGVGARELGMILLQRFDPPHQLGTASEIGFRLLLGRGLCIVAVVRGLALEGLLREDADRGGECLGLCLRAESLEVGVELRRVPVRLGHVVLRHVVPVRLQAVARALPGVFPHRVQCTGAHGGVGERGLERLGVFLALLVGVALRLFEQRLPHCLARRPAVPPDQPELLHLRGGDLREPPDLLLRGVLVRLRKILVGGPLLRLRELVQLRAELKALGVVLATLVAVLRARAEVAVVLLPGLDLDPEIVEHGPVLLPHALEVVRTHRQSRRVAAHLADVHRHATVQHHGFGGLHGDGGADGLVGLRCSFGREGGQRGVVVGEPQQDVLPGHDAVVVTLLSLTRGHRLGCLHVLG